MAALRVCLDTSLVVPIFLPDVFVERARKFLATQTDDVVIGDFAAAEFCSVVGNRVRNKELTASAARMAFSNFDDWRSRHAVGAETLPSDITYAMTFLRRWDLGLRTPDAMHLAIARRLGAELATFDKRMAAAARALGIGVVKA
jgi:predicted nucleic acid-binding protein